jgi:hypothetical protein
MASYYKKSKLVVGPVGGGENSTSCGGNDPDIARLHEKISSGKRPQSYILSALTNVPPKIFPYYIEFIHAIRMLLQYRYNIAPTSSLLDNENSLDGLPEKEKHRAVYGNDMASVEWGDLNIGEFSIIAHGAGEELERCQARGIPVVLLASEKGKAKPLHYYIGNAAGDISIKNVHIGGGGLSMMVLGNPAVKGVALYPKASWKTSLLQSLENIAWKMQYNTLGISWICASAKKLGKFICERTEGRNPMTIALHRLDKQLQSAIGLKPHTVALQEELQTAGAKKAGELNRKMALLDSLLSYHPLKTHMDYMDYKTAFPKQAKRASPTDLRHNRQEALYERTISPKFMTRAMKQQLRVR